ncbi:uncharacterized protein LOC131163858 [Malania oleifera]|uniref:uncharacterized protein LOC131163858 n=1 Tax=Malania oleifera TaxID=397392 RepID=UPI0025AE0D0B|nr:uncharacterized protein LOC131163858 [Malania oleifera]
MSLALLQGYSSAEEEEEEEVEYDDDQFQYQNSSDNDDYDDEGDIPKNRSIPDPKPAAAESLLPSALDAFSEIAGPPEFLNNCVEEHASARENDKPRRWHGSRRSRKERKDLPAGIVMEAKAQLVGIHERVRSDVGGNARSTTGQSQNDFSSTSEGVGKRVATATNPKAEDAAELLRMCLQCGIPKTYSSARGIVCPVCGDRPPVDMNKLQEKKKGSTIKEKEKSKRMKGQSSHASWKSETEMQLRQQFD